MEINSKLSPNVRFSYCVILISDCLCSTDYSYTIEEV